MNKVYACIAAPAVAAWGLTCTLRCRSAARSSQGDGSSYAIGNRISSFQNFPRTVSAEAFKCKRDHVVILNDAVWSIVQAQRGLHPIYVFPYRGRRVGTMNNNGWQLARREAGLPWSVHDLRHTFACRLRAAGVPIVGPMTRRPRQEQFQRRSPQR